MFGGVLKEMGAGAWGVQRMHGGGGGCGVEAFPFPCGVPIG